ncbi:MAG: hypothetical protein PF445_09610 [Melioribacteraceae bacterium]|jgi:hypothetical protein|nr:hypothetical protein [Melioribacteraceae bacterium]
MARPKKNITGLQVELLASYGLTNVEIAESFQVDESTIRKGFPEFLTKGRLNVKTKLRRAQIRVAIKGNVIMLIWLGKQMLGQVDKVESVGGFGINIRRSEIDFVNGEVVEVQEVDKPQKKKVIAKRKVVKKIADKKIKQ